MNEPVFSKQLTSNIKYDIVEDTNPFGEMYVIVYINEIPVSGLVIDEKRNGVIDVKNKINNSTRINPEKKSRPHGRRNSVDDEKQEDFE
jgi:hypothetical protein